MKEDLKLSTDGKKWKVSERGYHSTGDFWEPGTVFDTEVDAREYYDELIEKARETLYANEGSQWIEVERINRWA